MTDEQLRAALGSLPRDAARPGFTARVLRRLETEPRRFSVPRWTAFATAAALVLLTLGVGARVWHDRQERRDAIARLEAIESEKQALEAELATLRRLAADARPVMYLGGTEEVDLVLDLARFRQRNAGSPAGVVPAGYRLENDSPTFY